MSAAQALWGLPVPFLTGLLGAAVGAYAVLSSAHRRIRLEGVTNERQKWREKIRSLAKRLNQPGKDDRYSALASEFELVLNPFDRQDVAIIKRIRLLQSSRDLDRDREEISARLALLLKHDWQRSKRETSWMPLRLLPVRRRTYDELKERMSDGD